jgi:hypothetical protein
VGLKVELHGHFPVFNAFRVQNKSVERAEGSLCSSLAFSHGRVGQNGLLSAAQQSENDLFEQEAQSPSEVGQCGRHDARDVLKKAFAPGAQ